MLYYCATYTYATIRYNQSKTVIRIHSDGLYLSEFQSRRQAGGYFFLGAQSLNQNYNNWDILTILKTIKMLRRSVQLYLSTPGRP